MQRGMWADLGTEKGQKWLKKLTSVKSVVYLIALYQN